PISAAVSESDVLVPDLEQIARAVREMKRDEPRKGRLRLPDETRSGAVDRRPVRERDEVPRECKARLELDVIDTAMHLRRDLAGSKRSYQCANVVHQRSVIQLGL